VRARPHAASSLRCRPAPGSQLRPPRRCRKLLQTKLWPNAQTGRAWNQSVRPVERNE